MTELIPLMREAADVSAFSTCIGFNICTYAGADPALAADDLERLSRLTSIPVGRIIVPRQTHSVNVAVIGRGGPMPALDDTDALVTDRPGLLLCIQTADCLPLLLADTRAGIIGAAHCGWRGTADGIAAATVAAMASLGADPGHIRAAMGPCICPDCFEVGPEVAARFPARAVIAGPAGSRPHVSLPAAVTLQLTASGIPADSITPPPACSMTSPRLYSVRRQGRALTCRTLSAVTLMSGHRISAKNKDPW